MKIFYAHLLYRTVPQEAEILESIFQGFREILKVKTRPPCRSTAVCIWHRSDRCKI